MLRHAKGPSGKPSASSDAEESFRATIWVEKGFVSRSQRIIYCSNGQK